MATLVSGVALAEEKKAEKKKPYALKTCVVTDEELGSMGDPYVYLHEGREVQFCCKGCSKNFKKDPAKYLKKLDAAEKAAKK
jgi:YHS domain-containing protein